MTEPRHGGRPAWCWTARRSIRPRAASRSTPARWATSRVRGCGGRGRARRPRAVDAARTGRRGARRDRRGAAASITCSSTPANTSSRRPSIACSPARPSAFTWARSRRTIDLARPVSAADVERAVDEANRVVWEDRPVAVRFAQRRRGAVRPGCGRSRSARASCGWSRCTDFDLSACGGTHVARTGTIGIIAVTGTEKFKGGLRVSFVCGRRALDHLRLLRDAVTGSVRALSVLPAELPDAIRRLQADSKALRKRASELQVALAGHEADRLLALAAAKRAGGDGHRRHGRVGRRRPARHRLEPDRARPGSGRPGDRRRTGVDRGSAVGHRCRRCCHRVAPTSRFGGRGGGTRSSRRPAA